VAEVAPVKDNRHSGHTTTRLTAHIVWVTKSRYEVLVGDIKVRCRDLLMQICDAEDVRILKGVVSKDHIHMHIEYPLSKSLSDLVKRMKGRTSRRLQEEYPALRRGTGADTSGPSGTGHGARATSRRRRCKNTLSIIAIHLTGRVTRSSSNEVGLKVPRQPMHFQCIVVWSGHLW
jgi:putative transposase